MRLGVESRKESSRFTPRGYSVISEPVSGTANQTKAQHPREIVEKAAKVALIPIKSTSDAKQSAVNSSHTYFTAFEQLSTVALQCDGHISVVTTKKHVPGPIW